jgi:hypothetical protein
MPLFGTLPFAVGAVWIVHRVLRYRERKAGTAEEIHELRQQLEAVQHAQMEVQERLDFTERVLAQIRSAEQGARTLE